MRKPDCSMSNICKKDDCSGCFSYSREKCPNCAKLEAENVQLKQTIDKIREMLK